MTITKLIALERGNASNSNGADVALAVNQLIDGIQPTTTELIASTVVYSANTIVPTSGFTTSGGGGSGQWKQNGVTGQTVSQTPAQLGNGLLNDGLGNQWSIVVESRLVNPRTLGATGNGVVDDTPTIQAAINFAQGFDKQKVVYINQGNYLVRDTTGLLVAALKSFFMKGDGKGVSVIVFDNFYASSGSGRKALFTGNSADGSGTCILQGFSIIGKWGQESDFSEQQGMVRLNGYDYFYVDDFEVKGSRSGGLVSSSTKYVSVSNSNFEDCYRDSCRFESATSGLITNNTFKNIQDDCITLSSADTQAAPVDNTFVITGNIIIDSQGIIALGSKTTVISGNTIIRPIHRAIKVGQSPTFAEGRTSGFSIDINNNIIRDGFDGQTFSNLSGSGFDAIEIACKQLIAKDTVSTGSPVIKPYPYLYTNNTAEAATINAGMYNINVNGNVISRTLDATANYSDYGFGSRVSRSGVVDPAITLDDMCEYGIHMNGGGGDGLAINGNTIDGFKQNIKLTLLARTTGVSLQNYCIKHNIVKNFREAGVFANYNGLLEIKNNIFDGDVYNESTYRNTNGSWKATYNQHRAILIQNPVTEASTLIESNTFKNCGIPFWQGGAALTSSQMKSNTLVCQPVATGYNANNKGIGYMYQPVMLDASLVIEGSDPQASDYRKILTITATASLSLPTVGYYMTGMYVNDASGALRRGWKRITNGSGHVLNTDWKEDNF